MKSENYFWGNKVAGLKSTLRIIALAMVLLPHAASAGNFYAGTTPANVPWTNGIVPYEFTNTLSAAQKQTYLDGLREWELAANVKFVPHTNQTRWILFAFNSNNFNNVSSGYNPQIVNIASLSRSQVAHEMGHSFGFQHENIRTDQTNYLTVLSNNVSSGSYDFESVMHLAWDFASTQPGVLATQQPKPPYFPRYQFRMGNYALSPGDRAALKFLYGPPAVPLTNIVTTTADSGFGSLRAAMYYITDHPGSIVSFNIPISDPGYSNGVFTIHLTGQLPTFASDGMIIDGSTQPGFAGKPLIVVDASQIIPETFTSDTLLIYSANNQVKNISLQGFNWNGVTLLYADATNNTIAGCWIGVDSTGSNAAPNALQGILIVGGASRNLIGGTNALARNVISGNLQYGIWISDSNTTGNVVLGNYLGTDASGSNAVANLKSGVLVGGSAFANIIGSTNPLGRNILSGNKEYGIYMTNTTGNVVLGNYVGTDVSGTKAISNWFGGVILLNNSYNNVIGGTNALARNIISGNTNFGIWISGPTSTANTVQGNYVGLNAAGTAALPNTFAGMYLLVGAKSNLVTGNVFSGQPSEGLRIADAGTAWNLIQGNYFGTDASGLNVVENGFAGVTIFSGATSNTIGGTIPAARNIIAGGAYGFVAGDPGTSGNVVQGNYIGLGPDGVTPVPNYYYGVLISNRATNNTVGGTNSAARNIISGNYGSGIFLADRDTSANFIVGNFIGTDTNGTSPIANGYEGIYIESASGNFIGGSTAGAGNVISGNLLRGIYAYGTNTSGNLIQGNYIGTAADGASPLGNGWDGVVFFNGASSNVVGLSTSGTGKGNTIAFNGFTGVYVGSNNSDISSGNTIRGNSLHSNGEIGINLVGGTEDFYGVTANDSGDADTGPNNLQNYPVITNAVASGATTIISGTLNSAANRSFWIDVYMNFDADPSGYGQAQVPIGSVAITNNAGGNSVFTVNVGANYLGFFFSATATDKNSGDTSEFSADVMATNGPVVPTAPTFVGPITMTSTGFTAKISLTIGQNYRVQATTNLAANPIAWSDLTNFTASATNFIFLDRSATNFPRRFYRAVSP
jgi:parallel beta-helix repeat protein